MRFRLATADDVPALARLAAVSFSAKFAHLYPPDVHTAFVLAQYNEGATAALLADPAIETWLALDGTGLRAYAMLCRPPGLPHPDAGVGLELKRLYTAPDATGQGLGTRLMTEIVLPAATAASADTWLGVYSENHEAQRFYARFGFVRVGEYEFPVGPVRDLEFILRRKKPADGALGEAGGC